MKEKLTNASFLLVESSRSRIELSDPPWVCCIAPLFVEDSRRTSELGYLRANPLDWES